MVQYTERIPVDSAYAQALGYVIYNFATLEWVIVNLGGLIGSDFVLNESGADFESVAQKFSVLSGSGTHPEFIDISRRFTDATTRRKDLEKSIPITASGGVQELDGRESGNDYQWTKDNVSDFADELQKLDIEANALYYKLKDAPDSTR